MTSIYKFCYTNDANPEKGLHVSYMSPGMPRAVADECHRILGAKAEMRGPTAGEGACPPSVLEIRAEEEGTYVYVIGTRYGLRDDRGRAGMRSCACVLPSRQTGALTDANAFLRIGWDALEADGGGGEDLRAIQTLEPLSMERALGTAGLSWEGLGRLARAYYEYVTSRPTGPLYVRHGGSEARMRAVLYCLYQSVPWFLRRRFCCVSSEAAGAPRGFLAFTTRDVRGERWFFDVPSGDSSLESDEERRLLSYGFVDYAARKRMYEYEANRYFEAIERIARGMGDKDASDPAALRLAHICHTGDCSRWDGGDLPRVLYDAVREKFRRGPDLDRCVESILLEMSDKNVPLRTQDQIDKLRRYVGASGVAGLRDTYNEYALCRTLEQVGSPGGRADAPLAYLDLGDESERRLLAGDARGRDALDRHYSARVEGLGDASWGGLRRVAEESATLGYGRPLTARSVRRRADALLEGAAAGGGAPVRDLGEYLDLMRGMLPGPEFAEAERGAKARIWSGVTFGNVDFGDPGAYAACDDGSEIARVFVSYLRLAEGLAGGEERFLRDVHGFYAEFGRALSPQELEESRRGVQRLVAERCGSGGADRRLGSWADAASRLFPLGVAGGDAMELLLRLRRALAYDNRAGVIEACKGMHGLAVVRYRHEVDGAFGGCVGKALDAFRERDGEGPVGKVSIWAKHSRNKRPRNSPKENHITLDEWVAVSMYKYENPFEVFDHEAEEAVVMGSEITTIEKEVQRLEGTFDGKQLVQLAYEYIQKAQSENSRKRVQTWLLEVEERKKKKGSRSHNQGLANTHRTHDRQPNWQMTPTNGQQEMTLEPAYGDQRDQTEPPYVAETTQALGLPNKGTSGQEVVSRDDANCSWVSENDEDTQASYDSRVSPDGKHKDETGPSRIQLIAYFAKSIVLVGVLPLLIALLAFYFLKIDIKIVLIVESAYIMGYITCLEFENIELI